MKKEKNNAALAIGHVAVKCVGSLIKKTVAVVRIAGRVATPGMSVTDR